MKSIIKNLLKKHLISVEIQIGNLFLSKLLIRESLTVGMLGDIILPPLEISTNKAFYNYEAKYLVDDISYVLPNFDSQKKKLLTLLKEHSKLWSAKGKPS